MHQSFRCMSIRQHALQDPPRSECQYTGYLTSPT